MKAFIHDKLLLFICSMNHPNNEALTILCVNRVFYRGVFSLKVNKIKKLCFIELKPKDDPERRYARELK